MANTKKYGLTGVGTNVELGKKGIRIKNNSSVLEARNTGDSAFVIVRAANAVGNDDVVVLSQLNSAINGIDKTRIEDSGGTTYVDTDATANTINGVANSTNVFNFTSLGMQLGASGSRVTTILDEDNMGTDSATALATQQSIKAYVDNSISGLANGLLYMGTFDASGGDYSALANASQGDFYKISVGGTINVSGTKTWDVGDMLIINTDVTGNPVDSQVDKIDNTESADLLKASSLSSGQIFVGDGTSTPNSVSVTGDIGITSAGVTTIANGAVTVSKMEGLANGEIIIGVDGTAANNTKVTMSGDATLANTGVITIANSAVTYAKIQNASSSGIVLGRVTAGSGVLEEITIDTDLSSVSANDDTLASAKAVKAYVDGVAGNILRTAKATLVFGTTSPLSIVTVPAGSTVTKAIINVSTAFTGSNATLDIGDSGATGAVASNNEIDLTTTGIYVCDSFAEYASATAIIGTYAADSSTAGAATILLEYHS